MSSSIRAAALTTVLVLGGVSCADDDGGDEASAEAETTTTTEAGMGTEACDAVLGLSPAVAGGFNGPPTIGYLEDQFLPAVDAVVAADVDELNGPAAELQAAARAAIDGDRGDGRAEEIFGNRGEINSEESDDETVYGLYGELLAATHTDCGYEAIDVTAIDYEFEDVPETLAAGQASFSLTNDGNEAHQIVLFRRADGDTRPIEEIPALESNWTLTWIGSTSPLPGLQPGQTGYLLAELEPGRYATVCFLPDSTDGMVAEFEVT